MPPAEAQRAAYSGNRAGKFPASADFSLMLLVAAAALPLAAILVLMLLFRWSAARAALAGVAITLLLARVPFGLGTRVFPELGYWSTLAGAMAEAAFTTATILWILLPALAIHHLQVSTGRVDAIRAWMGSISDDPRIGLLLVVWFFTLFLEGAAGFGTPVALGAPLLVGLGVPPVRAVTAALVGHAVGVSFGAVGTPVAAQAAATGLAPEALARATAVYHAPLGWVLLVLAIGTAAVGVRGRGPLLPWTLAAAALFLAPMYAIARWIGPELPTLGGALAGGLSFVALSRLASRRAPAGRGAPLPLAAAAPYLALITLVLLTRLVPSIRAAATGPSLAWETGGVFAGGILPLYHPGTMLLAGFLLGAIAQRTRLADVGDALRTAARQLRPVTLALLGMLGLSRLMVHAGMIETLAQAAATLGAWWPLAAPFVGVLGTFVTGSATASNILMTDLQRATAEDLGQPVLTLLGAQGFGAAVGNVIAPHNIIAGCATVALGGREGDVLRRTIVVCLVYASLGGLLALAFVRAS